MRPYLIVLAIALAGCASPESKNSVSPNSSANNSNNANNATNGSTNNTTAENSNANNTTPTNNVSTNNVSTNNASNNQTTPGNNNTNATPGDCGDDEVFVEDECFECGPVDNCVRSGSACVPACVDNECVTRGFCIEGACRNLCG